jgi:hypothetical protein
MRAFVLIGLTVVLLLLFGCSGSAPQQQAPPNPSQTVPLSEQPAMQPPASVSPKQLSRVELCSKISDSDTKNWCLGIVNTDSSYCDKMTSPANENRRQRCYSFVAIEKQQSSICSGIKEPGAFQNCFSLASRNVSQCKLDPPQGTNTIKDSCIANYAALTNDVSICNQAEYKETCILRVAVSNGNAALCDSAGSWKDSCYFEIAVAKSDASLCEKIADSDSKQACNAIVLQDASRCSSWMIDICVQRIALQQGVYTQCESVQGISKDVCLFFMATKGLAKPYNS